MAAATPGLCCCCCCLRSPPSQTFESTAVLLASTQREGGAFTAAISAGLRKPLSSLWSANSSASSPSSRRGLTTEEERFPPRWALSNVGGVAPRRTYYRGGDGGRPNRMVAEVYNQNGGPKLQQKRGQFPRPPVIRQERDVACAVQLAGRVGRDIEIKYLDSGKVVATTSLVVPKGSQRTEDPSWFTLEMWDDLAKLAAHHVAKGELILVAGKIVVDKRVQDDVTYTNVKVVVRDFCFVEPSSDRRQPSGKSNDDFTARGSSTQSQAEVASTDSSQQNWNQQQLSSQPSHGAVPGFQGSRGHGKNVAQLEAQSPQTRAGASKWREAAMMIEQNRSPSRKGAGRIESRQQNTDILKVEQKRVGDTNASSTRSKTATDLLEIRERETLSREEEGQSSPISEGRVSENSVRQDLRTEELLSDRSDRSTPASMKAGLNLIAQGRLQSGASYGSRDWSRDTPQGNGSTHMQRAGSTSETIAVLQNRLQRGITVDSYTYVKVLQMCFKQKDLFAAKQIHECITQSGMDENRYVAGNLLNVYIKCGALVDARRVFDQLKKKSVVDWNIMIAGYANSDHAESALELFNQMRQEGFEPHEISYLNILKACTSLSALKWGKEIHECIRHAGFESDVRVGTALLKMYAKCGCIAEATRVFEKLTNRDVITWNVMIGGLAQCGCGHEAYRLFLQMRREGFEPNAITYLSILNATACAGALEWVKEVHGHASKAGLESDLRVGNALVHMYSKSGSIDDARLIFDRLRTRNVITWNTMIGAYAERGCGKEAYRLFCQMSREGLEPNAITYVSILNASASAEALEWVKEVHGHASKVGLESDLRVGNALVHMYAVSGNLDDARQCFDRIEKRDVVTWNVMIGGLAQHGCGHEAYRLFRQMRQEGVEPDAFTYASLLNASASAGALDWVKEVHGHASKAGLESDLRVGNALVHMYAETGNIDDARQVFDKMEKRDVVTWNVMIGGLAQCGCGHEAFRRFLQMRQEGFEPNAITYLSILNASAGAGALEWVKEVHAHAVTAGLESDLRVGTALVHMYAETGNINDARQVFHRMEKPNVVTWNVMIGGLAQHGCGQEALALFRKMNADLVKPDGTTFVAVLSACCHGGIVDDGRRLISAMKQDYGIEPDIVHYNCMVDLLGRAGHLEEAKRFIGDMRIEPNAVTWTAFLGACRTYGNVELGELAANKLFTLEASRASTYVLLSNIYAAAGKWEKVSLVRTMMQQRGVRKEPGRSWIEVDNKVHEFVAGDTSHPEAKAIYTELTKLTEKLKAEGYMPNTRLVLHDINEEDKELALCSHSEKLAIAYGLIHIPRGKPIRIEKNLRVCPDCHTATKLISKVTGREIIARDANRFHHFNDGMCSCGDYW